MPDRVLCVVSKKQILVGFVITRPALAGRSNLTAIHMSLLRRSPRSLLAKTKFCSEFASLASLVRKDLLMSVMSLRVPLEAGRSNLTRSHEFASSLALLAPRKDEVLFRVCFTRFARSQRHRQSVICHTDPRLWREEVSHRYSHEFASSFRLRRISSQRRGRAGVLRSLLYSFE
jgi:hypothetical protein